MYFYTVDEVLEPKNLTELIAKFKGAPVRRFERLEKYYRVQNEILRRTAGDGKPNNRLAHGFAKYITRMATGYFMGNGVKYVVPDEAYKDALFEVLKGGDTDCNNFELAKEASKKGIAFELLFVDEQRQVRAQNFYAKDIIPIYSQKVGRFMECAVRIWTQKGFGGGTTEYAEVYTATDIHCFSKGKGSKLYKLDEVRPHHFDDIPIVVYWNNEEQTGDYEDVISLIDAYDKAQSDTANDSEYFADAYFYISGASGGITDGFEKEGDEPDPKRAYATMRREKVLHFDEKGQAGFITKDINDKATENYKTRLYEDIFFIAQTPPMSDENFAGNLSGVAIRYKFVGLDEMTTEKERKFVSAQRKKIRLITGFLNTKNNKSYDPATVEVKIEYNLIKNETEDIKNIKALTGIISHQTQLEQLHFVKDAAAELERTRPAANNRPFYYGEEYDN